MAAAKWQQVNGAQKCENGRPKRSETDIPKSAKKCENDRGALFVDRFLAIFQWPYSGGHLGFPDIRLES